MTGMGRHMREAECEGILASRNRQLIDEAFEEKGPCEPLDRVRIAA